MKEAKDIEPNYGPVYAAAMYPDMAKALCQGWREADVR